MKKLRLQVDLDVHSMALLDELREWTGASSRAEVLRYSLGFYRWAVNHARKGHQIAAIEGDEDEPLEVLAMPGAIDVMVEKK